MGWMVACPALKTCTLLISRPGNLHKNWSVSCLVRVYGGAGSARLTRVMMDDTRLMTILYLRQGWGSGIA